VDQNHFLQHIGQRPEDRRQRRRCLLKGCEQWFTPRHPRTHYCSETCRQGARRWRRWQAAQRYRASALGRESRREQSRRYRQRCRERAAASADVECQREGQRMTPPSQEFSGQPCDRPGCYELFALPHEHSCKRFCSLACRLALRRVLDREARYRARRRRRGHRRLTRRIVPPNTS